MKMDLRWFDKIEFLHTFDMETRAIRLDLHRIISGERRQRTSIGCEMVQTLKAVQAERRFTHSEGDLRRFTAVHSER